MPDDDTPQPLWVSDGIKPWFRDYTDLKGNILISENDFDRVFRAMRAAKGGPPPPREEPPKRLTSEEIISLATQSPFQ